MKIPGIRRAVHLPWITKRQLEHEIDDELRDHLERRVAQLIAAGLTPDAARAEADRRFGDYRHVRDECIHADERAWRTERVRELADQTIGDVKFAWRAFARSRGFSAVVISTLVIGIASLTAIFSFVYSFYWRPLPYPSADRLVAIVEHRARGTCCFRSASLVTAQAIARTSRSFSRTTIFDEEWDNGVFGAEARQLRILLIDTSFAPTFSLHAQLGRLLAPDDVESDAPVAVISDDLWRGAFGADTNAIGRRVRVGAHELTIVGVMPPRFGFPWKTDLWEPRASHDHSDDESQVGILGTLRQGVSRDQAATEMRLIAARLSRDAALGIGRTELELPPEIIDRRANQGAPFPSLFVGAALMVLLIASANVMNLFLARTAERKSEIAIRTSMGATRSRLIRQLLCECALLVSIAGVLGIAGAALLTRLAAAFYPREGLPSWLAFGLDARVLLFVIAVVMVVTIAVGLTPALEGTGFDLVKVLKNAGDGGVVRGGVARSAKRGLAIQLALSIALFVGALMFVRSYERLSHVDVGYPAERIVGVQLFFGGDDSSDRQARLRLVIDAGARLGDMPNAERSAIRGAADNVLLSTDGTPAGDANKTTGQPADFRLISDRDTTRAVSDRNVYPFPRFFAVSDSYFATLGVSLVSGRTFGAVDAPGALPAVVVSQRLAKLLWPRGNAVGGVLQRGADGPQFTVVGVVRDVRDLQGGSRGVSASPRADAYFSLRQVGSWSPEILVRARISAAAVQASALALMRRIAPSLVTRASTLAGTDELSLMTEIFGAIIGAFALSGLLLSMVGLYGLVAYGISQRRREIGVRIALGATRESVVGLVMRESMKFIVAGLAGGLILSLGTSRVLHVVLFEVSTLDAPVYGMACVLFGSVAALASYLPALRAARINPVSALKSD